METNWTTISDDQFAQAALAEPALALMCASARLSPEQLDRAEQAEQAEQAEPWDDCF